MIELSDIQLVHAPGTPTQTVALDGLDLTVAAGEFITIVGSNGAGKSSLVQVISGALFPTVGRVRIHGQDVTRLPEHRRAARVARVFDDPHAGTAPDLSIEENLALAMARGRRRRLRRALDPARADRMRDHLRPLGLGLEDRLHTPVATLSSGQRQSLTMVMAGLTEPDVLLLDEHTAALDPGTQQTVLGLTTDLAATLGCTTVMVTHDMQRAIEIGDRLVVMDRGRVAADIGAEQKAALTVKDLVDHVTREGGAVSDRSLLGTATTPA